MKALSVAQIREADRRCIQELGIPGPVLMNTAGQAVFRAVREGPVGVVCGKGNNGGDGFVVARLALVAGLDVRTLLLADPGEIMGDARIFMDAYRRLGGEVVVATKADAIAREMALLSEYSTLIDAILGTGVNGEVRGAPGDAIAHWPHGVYSIAVDVPSGLNADTGKVCGACVRADVTVTFQFMKRGFENVDAKPYLGRLEVADIGIPPVCADDDAWRKLKNP